jgi:hypothetical protein
VPDPRRPIRSVVLRRTGALLLVLAAAPMAYLGALGLTSPDYFDVAGPGTLHFYAAVSLTVALVAVLAALCGLSNRRVFRRLALVGASFPRSAVLVGRAAHRERSAKRQGLGRSRECPDRLGHRARDVVGRRPVRTGDSHGCHTGQPS